MALFLVCWASGYHIVFIISYILKYNSKHPTDSGLADDNGAPYIALALYVISTPNLFHLLHSNPMAGDVSYIPWVPDESTNEWHTRRLF
jgi:hypothetical protein